MVNYNHRKTRSHLSKGTFPTYNGGPLYVGKVPSCLYIYIITIIFTFSCNYFRLLKRNNA